MAEKIAAQAPNGGEKQVIQRERGLSVNNLGAGRMFREEKALVWQKCSRVCRKAQVFPHFLRTTLRKKISQI